MIQRSVARDIAIAAALPYLVVVIFSGKAFHIDDPAYLWSAEHILKSPLDFYGFEVNWGGTDVMMYEANKNPPGVSYYIALGAWLFGWGERAQHLWMGLWASALGVGTYLLARRFGTSGLWAVVTTLSMPVVMVSVTTVMADVQMLALYTGAIVCWMYGLDRKHRDLLMASGLLAAAAFMTKYFGATLLPLLFVYGLLRERRVGNWCLHLLIPAVVIVLYLLWARYLYGLDPLAEAGKYTTETALYTMSSYVNARPLIGVVFAGGCMTTVLFYAPLLWRGRTLAIGAVVGVAGLLLAARYDGYFFYKEAPSAAQAFQFSAHYVAFLLCGIGVLALGIADVRRARDADAALLLLWLFGTFVFATVLNWSVTARTILPMAVPTAILVSRRIDQHPVTPSLQRWRWALLVPALGLTMWVTYGDYASAALMRRAADQVHAQAKSYAGDYWFMGHWGYQYYLQENGSRYLTQKNRANLKPGDRIAVVRWLTLDSMDFDATSIYRVPDAEIVLRNPSVASLHHPVTRSGFYTSVLGPLPFTLGPAPDVVIEVLQYQPATAQ